MCSALQSFYDNELLTFLRNCPAVEEKSLVKRTSVLDERNTHCTDAKSKNDEKRVLVDTKSSLFFFFSLSVFFFFLRIEIVFPVGKYRSVVENDVFLLLFLCCFLFSREYLNRRVRLCEESFSRHRIRKELIEEKEKNSINNRKPTWSNEKHRVNNKRLLFFVNRLVYRHSNAPTDELIDVDLLEAKLNWNFLSNIENFVFLSLVRRSVDSNSFSLIFLFFWYLFIEIQSQKTVLIVLRLGNSTPPTSRMFSHEIQTKRTEKILFGTTEFNLDNQIKKSSTPKEKKDLEQKVFWQNFIIKMRKRFVKALFLSAWWKTPRRNALERKLVGFCFLRQRIPSRGDEPIEKRRSRRIFHFHQTKIRFAFFDEPSITGKTFGVGRLETKFSSNTKTNETFFLRLKIFLFALSN